LPCCKIKERVNRKKRASTSRCSQDEVRGKEQSEHRKRKKGLRGTSRLKKETGAVKKTGDTHRGGRADLPVKLKEKGSIMAVRGEGM